MKTSFPRTRIPIQGSPLRSGSPFTSRAGMFLGALVALLVFLTPLRSALLGAFRFLVAASAGVANGDTPLILWGRYGTVLAERDALLAERADRESSTLLAQAIASDLADLRRAFRRSEDEETLAGSTVAAVLARPPRIAYDTLLIDRGSDDGVRVGTAVYAVGSVYLGTVVRADRTTSLVELVTSAGKETDALMGPDLIPVTAIGAGGGMFSFSVPSDLAVGEGDGLYLPTLDERILGVVGEVEQPEASSFATVRARLPIGFSDLRFVYVAARPL